MKKIQIQGCEFCKSMKNQRLEQRLQKAFPDAEIEMKCQSYCGPGSRVPFVMIDDEIIEAPTIDLLIEAIKKYVQNEMEI